MRLLDLFCCAGGAAKGYADAGFEVVGVDIKPQPHYPFEFHQADALEFSTDGFDAIHGSPPCQAFTHGRHIGNRGRTDHPRLIAATRAKMIASGLPYIIENVEGARSELINPILLCGSMFGLDVERHRLFEGHVPFMVPRCQHGVWLERKHPSTPRADGSRPLSRIVNPMASGCAHEDLAEAMGIDWMPQRGFRPTEELREAIPPRYTEYIGQHLLARIEQKGCFPAQISVPVTITLPDGGKRKGWHEEWRHLVVWKEIAARDDLDEMGEPEGWYWAHAHESEIEWEPISVPS